MTTQPTRTQAEVSIRRTLIVGLTLVGLLAGSVGGIAANADMAGAVVANGSFVVGSYVKKVQHQTGGTVGVVYVHEGDKVSAGQVLVRLDDTQIKANLEIVLKKLDELTARQARLAAEREGLSAIVVPAELTQRRSDPAVAALIASEQRLFDLRRKARAGQKAQLEERIGQLRQEVDGLLGQKAAKEQEIAILMRELTGTRVLFSKGLITLQRVTQSERDLARLKGELGQLIASIAQNAGKVAETRLQILQVDKDAQSEVAKDLRETEAQMGESRERKIAAADQLQHVDIRAPQDGVVHELTVHAAGAVVTPGEPIMQIVPVGDALLVEVRIAPQDIDQLTIGQQARLRLTAFNQRTTPELDATVEEIAPDLSQDTKTGAKYYTVRLRIAKPQFARLGNLKVMSGMPAEAFIRTQSRTMLSYLVKPLRDQIERAFREE